MSSSDKGRHPVDVHIAYYRPLIKSFLPMDYRSLETWNCAFMFLMVTFKIIILSDEEYETYSNYFYMGKKMAVED